MRWLSCLCFVLGVTPSFGQLTVAERKGLQDGLYIKNLTLKELGFSRIENADPKRLSLIDLALRDPLQAYDNLGQLNNKAISLSDAAWVRASLEILGSPAGDVRRATLQVPDVVPVALQKPVSVLVSAISECNEQIRGALSRIDADEKRELIESLPQWAVGSSSVIFDFARRRMVKQSRIELLLAKVDLVRIQSASFGLMQAVEAATKELKAVSKGLILTEPLKIWIDRIPVVISGYGSDVHDEREPMLTIDLGGNDHYSGRHGAGIGYSSVLIDLDGDDIYETPDANLGSGILGVGIAIDGGGNDVFRCRSASLGCGLAGVGIFQKTGGDDSYRTAALGLGFGQFGMGMFLDRGGDDDYRGTLFCQGASRTGGLGWMIDRLGRDRYEASSNCQGASSGYSGGTSGGVAILSDFEGDDVFSCRERGQGFGTGYAVGCLFDSSGSDLYLARDFAQACGTDQGFGSLTDLSGNDRYNAAGSLALASGFRNGIGLLVDRLGDDTYSCLGGQAATGFSGGVGLLLEGDGDDVYGGTPGRGFLGLFCDLSGTDRYSSQSLDGEAGPSFFDRVSDQRKPDVDPVVPKAGSKPRPSDAELAKLCDANELFPLIAIGVPALDWMISNRLSGMDSGELALFVGLVDATTPDGGRRVATRLTSSVPLEVQNAFRICIESGTQDAIPYVSAFLKKSDLRRLAVEAVGKFKLTELGNELLPLCLDSDPSVALAAAESLSGLADPSMYSTAEALIRSSDPRMRAVAFSWAAKLSPEGMAGGLRLAEDTDERVARLGIELLSYFENPKVTDALIAKLGDPRPGVRIQAMLALDGKVPAASYGIIAGLRRDTNPIVRAVASRISMGR